MSAHLAVLTLDFPPDVGGIQTYLYEVARRLGEAHSVSVITPVAGDLPLDIPISKVEPVPCNVVGFWRVLRNIDPDHVIVGHAHPQLLLAALLAGKRYGVIIHGNDFLAAQRCWHASIFNWVLKRAEPVITNSDVTSERLRAFVSIRTITVHPGADPVLFTPLARDLHHSPSLVSVSRLVPCKGIDTVLRVLPVVREIFPDIHYYVAGNGPELPHLKMLAQELGIEANVSFLGCVSGDKLRAVYHQAHIFVMPSIESFGIVYLEASASGLPVVAGRSGGAVEAVRDGKTGYLVDPHDPEALADVLLSLLRDPERCRAMGRAGRQWVEQEMNWDRAARQVADALQLRAPK